MKTVKLKKVGKKQANKIAFIRWYRHELNPKILKQARNNQKLIASYWM